MEDHIFFQRSMKFEQKKNKDNQEKLCIPPGSKSFPAHRIGSKKKMLVKHLKEQNSKCWEQMIARFAFLKKEKNIVMYGSLVDSGPMITPYIYQN
uniref:Uncharacterized protein n=1 Tax=Nelumbo nucifera TaxID=4432 RepID=A0A822XFQ0_NELNU|nr:TPA_asm: hypothetical protein HUJ06_019309 [Nelumbo nucifera]